MSKRSFIAVAAAAVALYAIPLSGASAGEDDAGYNTSDTDTVTIGSDPNTGGATQDDYDQMQQIQQGMQDLKESHDAAPGDSSPDDSTDADDSSGH
jgi:hypothetical protein